MLISQSEWARQKGFSRQYVGKLVSQGTIQLVDGKIDTVQAENALASIREPARELQRATIPTATSAKMVIQEKPAPTVPPVVFASPTPTPATKPAAFVPRPMHTVDLPSGSAGDLSTLLLKARIKSEVKRASLLEIREKVETGKLVDADEMEMAAFNRGRAVRAAWEAWPNRV
ncbi:MAG: hypothetical protein HQM04_17890, partial [Magnetococcales bacterium]|nr:hypothetical protein [Magnetococcales bacterium]